VAPCSDIKQPNVGSSSMSGANAESAIKSGRKIVVVGAGIIGLTTAIRLRENGHEVHIITQESPTTILDRENSSLDSTEPGMYTSAGSGGLWMPIFLEGDEVEQWSAETYRTLEEHEAIDVGVSVLDSFFIMAKNTPTEMPWYSELSRMDVVTPAQDDRIPKEYSSGFRFSAPIVQMGRYLSFLQKRLEELNVPLELTSSHSPSGASDPWDYAQVSEYTTKLYPGEANPIIVNCCGIGAQFLTGEEMVPGRGITVRVKRPAAINYSISESKDDGHQSHDGLLAYCIPRGDEYTLGGTLLLGDWRQQATEEDVRLLKERCEHLLPGIGTAVETGRWTGLRPMRKSGRAKVGLHVRQDDVMHPIAMIDNYGHGGSGLTTCWGCANAVVRIVKSMN